MLCCLYVLRTQHWIGRPVSGSLSLVWFADLLISSLCYEEVSSLWIQCSFQSPVSRVYRLCIDSTIGPKFSMFRQLKRIWTAGENCWRLGLRSWREWCTPVGKTLPPQSSKHQQVIQLPLSFHSTTPRVPISLPLCRSAEKARQALHVDVCKPARDQQDSYFWGWSKSDAKMMLVEAGKPEQK